MKLIRQIAVLNEKCNKRQKLLANSNKTIMFINKQLKKNIINTGIYKKKLDKMENANKGKGAYKIFNNDQIQMLNQNYKKMGKWCDKTLVNAY